MDAGPRTQAGALLAGQSRRIMPDVDRLRDCEHSILGKSISTGIREAVRSRDLRSLGGSEQYALCRLLPPCSTDPRVVRRKDEQGGPETESFEDKVAEGESRFSVQRENQIRSGSVAPPQKLMESCETCGRVFNVDAGEPPTGLVNGPGALGIDAPGKPD